MSFRLTMLVILMSMLFAGAPIADSYAQNLEGLSYEEAAKILDQADIRGFVWGLPSSIIKAEEKAIFVEEDETGALFYVDTIRDLKSSVTYEFENDKLFRVQTFIEKKYSKPQERVQDLVKIKQDLVRRFGEPESEEFDWATDTDKGSPEVWGWTVYRGELTITLKWKTSRSLVTVYLGSPTKYDPIFVITYEDRLAHEAKLKAKEGNPLKIAP